eukprot:CAMPEP_0173438256 /NCGR_PEP_ID=MMETSP1357-20121228/19879_1 /TAXON_ID=77926 /ORGANISM="Hemiselmis rufescens, Strain PCC563" /LENGTH=52 /DNA_ID=CAMNT_0014403533 /DNA_START=224 /DNA_END=379 /DNA_ORIENTATION=+
MPSWYRSLSWVHGTFGDATIFVMMPWTRNAPWRQRLDPLPFDHEQDAVANQF